MPRGLRQIALSISFLSPIVRRPDALGVTKIASLIFRPERRFLAVTSFQSLRRPSLSFGSSSLISLRRQSLSLSRARLRPPGNIQSPSRFRLTRSTRPRFAATSFEDFAIPPKVISVEPTSNPSPKTYPKFKRRAPQLAALIVARTLARPVLPVSYRRIALSGSKVSITARKIASGLKLCIGSQETAAS
jgi:hypothetical protein